MCLEGADQVEALDEWLRLLPGERVERTASRLASLDPLLARLPWVLERQLWIGSGDDSSLLCTLSAGLISKIAAACKGPFWVQYSAAEAAAVIRHLYE